MKRDFGQVMLIVKKRTESKYLAYFCYVFH